MEKIIKVSGMACEHCKAAVTNGLLELDGVLSVEVSLEDATAKIISSKDIDDKVICDTIYDLGFDAEI